MCSQPDEGQESLQEELDVLVLHEEGDQVSYPPMVCPPATPRIITEQGDPCVTAVCQSCPSDQARDSSLSHLVLGVLFCDYYLLRLGHLVVI